MNDSLYYSLFFSYFVGIGPVRFDRLRTYFGTLEKMYTAPVDILESLLGPTLTKKLVAFRSTFNPESEYTKLQEKDVQVVTRDDPSYPKQFHQLSDPPICLYVKGDISGFDYERDLFFAIVGTRTPTDYGRMIAKKFAQEMTEAGFVIVSGMAMGIDAVAHWGALAAGGRTVAFLGCGVNIPYPSINRTLYAEILEKGGLIISESPPDMMVMKGLFVSRNRLIAGLSIGTLVAEGLKDSGSLITARCALEQGKEVFAPPAPISSDQSAAPNMLIKDGAKMVTCLQDILEEFQMQSTPASRADVLKKLGPLEQKVYLLLAQEPFTSDEIAQKLQIPIHAVLTSISSMELGGILSKGSAGKYLVELL